MGGEINGHGALSILGVSTLTSPLWGTPRVNNKLGGGDVAHWPNAIEINMQRKFFIFSYCSIPCV